MENREFKRGQVEMSVVCSDLSLLESINSLLRQKGVIVVEDESGGLHYIVDGRHERYKVPGRVTAINPRKTSEKEREKAYLELCIKSVLREYGFDMALVGTVIISRAFFAAFSSNLPIPTTMKSLYCETGEEFGLSYEQSERDVRYAIAKSSLKNMRSRAAMRCIQARIERRLGYLDPLN